MKPLSYLTIDYATPAPEVTRAWEENMTTIYDVIAERHRVWNGHEFAENPKPEVILFYDEDRETAVRFMQKYDKQHGFTMKDKGMTTTIANLILRERYSTGEEISRTPYCEVFDELGNRRKP